MSELNSVYLYGCFGKWFSSVASEWYCGIDGCCLQDVVSYSGYASGDIRW